jgi:hypothetical protein
MRGVGEEEGGGEVGEGERGLERVREVGRRDLIADQFKAQASVSLGLDRNFPPSDDLLPGGLELV